MSVHGTEISLISCPGTKLRSSQNPRHTLPKENISSANRNSFIPVQVMYAELDCISVLRASGVRWPRENNMSS